MERTVAELASKLLSDDATNVLNALVQLKKRHTLRAQGPLTSRLIQELAIYQQGAILKKLLKQVLDSGSLIESSTQADTPSSIQCAPDRRGEGLAQCSFFALIFLSSHKGAARLIVKDETTAVKLMRRFMEHLPNGAAYKRRKLNGVYPYTVSSVHGLVHFSRGSKTLRQNVRDRGDLLPALQSLLSDSLVKQEQVFTNLREDLSDFMLALTLAEDSQVWMVEKGYLQLMADVCRTELQDEHEDAEDASALCSMALFRLCASPACVEKMKEIGAFSILSNCSERLDASAWNKFVLKMSGAEGDSRSSQVPKVCTLADKASYWKRAEATFAYTPTVCSWEGCTETADIETETKFYKCGRCAVAHYCRYVLRRKSLTGKKLRFTSLGGSCLLQHKVSDLRIWKSLETSYPG